MKRTFIELPSFMNQWKEMGLTDSDLIRLEEELLANPEIGKVIRETGGVRKMRFPFEHRSKSDSVRVIYVDIEVREKIFLLTAYPKSKKSNLTKAERNALRTLVGKLKEVTR